jgi:shikimate kinase
VADTGYQRIYLIGFMGAGKSSVGECLARILSWRFVDLDRTIERETGRSVPAIFASLGEQVFRRLETETLVQASAAREAVIACGGGTPASRGNMELILATGLSIWLRAPLPVMLARCREGAHRPLLGDESRMIALLAARTPWYERADMIADSSSSDPEAIAREIVDELSRRGGS